MGKRILYLDWLRVVATFMVVLIHVSAGLISINYFEGPSNWLATNAYESISRMSVPLFVMISGALLLNSTKEIDYSLFLTKRVGKIIVPLLGWSFIYYCFQVYANWHPSFSIIGFIKLFLNNGISVHFWFMYMILGIYLTVPIIKIFVKNATQKDIVYFLLLWFYTSVVVKFMKYNLGYSLNIELFHVTNYIGYFVLGYFLSNLKISKINFIKAIVLIFIGILTTFFLTYFATIQNGGALVEFWYEYHAPNVVIAAIGMFYCFKYLFNTSLKTKLPVILTEINKFSFGIYLVHMLVMLVFLNSVISFLRNEFHFVIAVPLITIFVVVVSTIITFIFSRIPFFRKLVP